MLHNQNYFNAEVTIIENRQRMLTNSQEGILLYETFRAVCS